MQSRRKFLQAAGTVLFAANQGESAFATELSSDDPVCISATLHDGWLFRIDPTSSLQPPAEESSVSWEPVQVPHTWQSLGKRPDYSGVAWYKLVFTAPRVWQKQHIRMEFEAVTHTAHIFLNGTQVGEHIGKGYTAFTVNLSSALRFGEQNTLLVRVENRPSDRMLPRNKSYDWTDDGGIIRPVNLLVTPQLYIHRIEIDAEPNLEDSSAKIDIRAIIRNETEKPQRMELHAMLQKEGSIANSIKTPPVSQAIPAQKEVTVSIKPTEIRDAALWHFDSPNLYSAMVTLNSDLGEHQLVDTFGIRRFEIQETDFYLNGEKVLLMGVERMAGSHPDIGMAETAEWIQKNHEDMKDLNCIYTRVHWPQDRRVLDFCDRNGILMQQEIPAWGSETFRDASDEIQRALEQNGIEQLREMIARDRNHPCVIAWGLCNEVDGKNPRTKQFAHKISNEARNLDPSRLQTYASHSLNDDPGADMAGDFDFISTNEYFGSWYPGGPPDVEAHIGRIRKAFPNKPIVISEYGWCECQEKITPGDNSRVDIVNSHTEVIRKSFAVAGAIYFDYNDYRTLIGDKGIGAMKQRVHGVVDVYGTPKPSFQALRLQGSPIESLVLYKISAGKYKLDLTTRRQLPAYTLRGYGIRCIAYGYDDLPMAGCSIPLRTLTPGSTHSEEILLEGIESRKIKVDILRPNGYSVITTEHRD